ncbi:asparaginase domain-containing protein [Paenirhodobacter populi]|uniref:Aminopeptidase n=1 Tax=Paenirhodobacter populi TaxID=2306993 RepID=A0A443JMC5_9RHOB|nr:asparaginase domain-containing protein [Sinirhodobacter populi]RWR21651.1 aminopeptidase [Sinirhodobacter populi]
MKLLIHTGGTIGMAPGGNGLAPAPGVVEAAVRGRARVTAFDPLLDSADLNHGHWNRLLDLIEAENGPVIVTHGTDTLSFTGAALSQALVGWPHPVVLTAAMQPLGMGGDAEGNLDLALAAEPGPGVWLAFAGRLVPAGGLVKAQSHAADAFRAIPLSPGLGPWRRRRFAGLRLAILTVSPGLPVAMLRAALAELDGAVLRVFGAGTIPSDPALETALREAVARGCRLRAVSICENGGLSPGAYAAGAALWRAGVENGAADTAEAALIRLWLELSETALADPARMR